MSAQPYETQPMSEAEYLAFEDGDIRYEYVNGEIYAMTGATIRHNTISHNIDRTLGNQLEDKDCIVNSSETRVKVDAKKSYRYPDIVVVCGKIDYLEKRRDTITNPTVLVEVLSPSTALVDINQKLGEYTEIPSLQEYVIVAQDEYRVERYLRRDDGSWLYNRAIGLDGVMNLPSIGCKLALSTVYAKLDLLDDE